MVKLEELLKIREMKNRGMSIKQIAEYLDLNRKTVSKWLKAEKLPAYQRTGKSTSKLDKYKEYIVKRMMEGCLNAMVILDEITEMGYTGKIGILREFMKPYRKHHKGPDNAIDNEVPLRVIVPTFGDVKPED